MSYNVHGCVGVDGRLDLGRIAAVIAASRPDIVALQELDVGRARSGGVDQAQAIAARLGMRFHFNAALNVEEERYGDAILTALPERLVKAGPLPVLSRLPRNETRGALWAAVQVGGREVQVINTHFGLAPPEQRRQAACLIGAGWLGHPDCRDPAILLGDLNATSRYAAYRILAGRMRDAQKPNVQPPKARAQEGRRRDAQRPPADGGPARAMVRTFPSRLPLLRIDHCFVTRSVHTVGVHAPSGALARAASDHLPLVIDVQLSSAEADLRAAVTEL